MRNIIDERIYELAEKSELEIPQGYEEHVTCLLDSLNEDKTAAPRRIPFRRIAAMAAMLVFVFSIGAYATINYVNQRMQEMEDSEKSRFLEGVQKGEADYYSRPFTEQEEKRLEELLNAYVLEGKFPASQILQVNFTDEVPDDTLCFVITVSTFYFPEREMTDEELLEFIDFYYKRDYSVVEAASEWAKMRDTAPDTELTQEDANTDKHANGEVTQEDANAAIEVTEQDAAAFAMQLLKDIFQVDMMESDYAIERSHYETDVMSDKYWIQVPKVGAKYVVSIDAQSGQLKSMQYLDITASEIELKADEESYISRYDEIAEILRQKIAPNQAVIKAYLEYQYDFDNILYDGIVSYYFELDNQTGYIFGYNCKLKKIYIITYVENSSIFKQILQENLNYSQVHRTTQRILEIQ